MLWKYNGLLIHRNLSHLIWMEISNYGILIILSKIKRNQNYLYSILKDILNI